MGRITPDSYTHLAFRPFPAQAIAQALQNVKAVAVMDKADSFSACGGPLGAEVRAALYQYGARVSAVNFVYGLGGRDVRVDDFYAIYRELQEVSDGKDYPMFQYIGVRE